MKTVSHHQLTDSEFETQFRECSLDPKLFSHEAHLRLAFIHIKRYGLQLALKNICEQISKFDQVFGDGDKFNTTVTIASIKAINHFMQKATSNTFQGLLDEFPRLKSNFKNLLAFHYSIDIFKDKEAKSRFVEPDLLPF